jgi:short-subunit dehydrogenase
MAYHSFINKSIIITGASRGIGRELALQLAEQGAFLTLAARDTDLLAQVAEQCVKKGGKAIAVTTDITIEDQCKTLILRANEEYGQIDVLINNAGIADKSRFEELRSLYSGEMVMRVNFWGSTYCTYYAMPYLKKTKGRIVVINSGAGKFPSPTSIFYGASKHALDGFFDSLRPELQTSGVTVTSIYPDWVATGISTRSLGSDGKSIEKMSPHEHSAINAGECAKIIIKAAGKRKRMAFMSFRQRVGYCLRPFFPNLIDHTAGKAFE